jgi:heat shock protein HtpX
VFVGMLPILCQHKEFATMVWFKRIALFLITNILVIITISVVLNLLGVQPYLGARGINYGSLMAFCLVWGMGGAFISLLLSKVMAKWMMGVKVIDPETTYDSSLRQLVNTVHLLARQAGLLTMPEVGVYESPEINAFATGPTKNRSLVAVSSGLLNSMDQRSLEGVLGHEIAHIANGDMVTMTLLQGIVNAFVMFAARAIAFAIDNFLRGDRDREGGGLGQIGYMLTVFVLEMVFMLLGSIVVASFSRWREFRADKGGAQLAGREKMIAALRSLQRVTEINMAPESQGAPAYAAMKISSNKTTFMSLFSTHPALDDRIARLEQGL